MSEQQTENPPAGTTSEPKPAGKTFTQAWPPVASTARAP